MKTTLTTIAALLLSTAAMADNVPQGGVKNSPATVALTAIGNGTPAQGVVRLTGPDGSQTFHAVDHTTTYRRAQGGTAVVNGGDGFTNAHEAELRNRQAIIDSLPTPVDGKDGADGTNGRDGADGRDGQDFDANLHQAMLATSTALGSLQMMDPLAGETTWSVGLGGQFDGDSAIAAGIRHGFTDDLSGYLSVSTTFDGKGTSYGAGFAGRF